MTLFWSYIDEIMIIYEKWRYTDNDSILCLINSLLSISSCVRKVTTTLLVSFWNTSGFLVKNMSSKNLPIGELPPGSILFICTKNYLPKIHPDYEWIIFIICNTGISLLPFSEFPNPPEHSICVGKQNEDIDCDGELGLWSVMAKAPHGNIPGNYFCILYLSLF